MLDWFNALWTLFKEFLELLLDLPFYGSVTIGFVIVAIMMFGVVFRIFIERIK